METSKIADQTSDQGLIELLPGFTNGYALVNGIRLHYVIGGKGEPLILLPGWPETWWSYHKLMPILAKEYEVVIVDLRGMGSSDKPLDGYTKRNMAKDILELTAHLGYGKVNIAGHDIGAGVAFSYAANYPENTDKLILLDTPHPDENMYRLPMLPVGSPVYPWWVAFNQVKELPEALLEGRYHLVQEWLFNELLLDKQAIDSFDRGVYRKAYDTKDGIRASNAWYQTFTQDIEDMKGYKKISMPVIGIGGGSGYEMLKFSLPPYVESLELRELEGAGHFVHEEKPQETARAIMDFLK